MIRCTKRFRVVRPCPCGDVTHRVGLTRDGRLIALDHSYEETQRWLAFAELGGELPACIWLCEIHSPVAVTVSRHLNQANRDVQYFLYHVQRIRDLREARASAKTAPGQGKRNRKHGMPQPPYVPPAKPYIYPKNPWEDWAKWAEKNDGIYLSKYRRQRRRWQIMYAPRSKKKRRHRWRR